MPAEIRKLSDCAEVIPGYSLKVRAEHEPEGTFQIIMAKHIPDGVVYKYREEHELRITPGGSEGKYRVYAGDVLFISRGTRNQATAVISVPERTIASSTLYILRVKNDVDPVYFAWAMNQSPIQSRIAQIRTGAGTPIVQRSLFGNLQIPVPSIQRQKYIAEVGALMAQEKELNQKLVVAMELKHGLIGQQLLNQLYEMSSSEE